MGNDDTLALDTDASIVSRSIVRIRTDARRDHSDPHDLLQIAYHEVREPAVIVTGAKLPVVGTLLEGIVLTLR